jgi:hypothetical protein
VLATRRHVVVSETDDKTHLVMATLASQETILPLSVVFPVSSTLLLLPSLDYKVRLFLMVRRRTTLSARPSGMDTKEERIRGENGKRAIVAEMDWRDTGASKL